MIRNYLEQLRNIQADRNQFQNQHKKGVIAKELCEQEDKYQAYIIGQMASENRVVAACHLTTVF